MALFIIRNGVKVLNTRRRRTAACCRYPKIVRKTTADRSLMAEVCDTCGKIKRMVVK